MKDGFYWYEEVNGDVSVIEMSGGDIYTLGDETTARLVDQEDRGQFRVLGGKLLGPVAAPQSTQLGCGVFEVQYETIFGMGLSAACIATTEAEAISLLNLLPDEVPGATAIRIGSAAHGEASRVVVQESL